MPAPSTGTRARARAQTIDDLKRVARAHLATDGADLSLRSVARELGMVSSAVYRYFESRDALLTALIIDAYDDLGDASERAEAAVRRTDLRGRWLATAHAVRDWSRTNRAEYGLLYGTPVPGYSAPEDTIGPAVRTVVVMTSHPARRPRPRAAARTPPRATPRRHPRRPRGRDRATGVRGRAARVAGARDGTPGPRSSAWSASSCSAA